MLWFRWMFTTHWISKCCIWDLINRIGIDSVWPGISLRWINIRNAFPNRTVTLEATSEGDLPHWVFLHHPSFCLQIAELLPNQTWWSITIYEMSSLKVLYLPCAVWDYLLRHQELLFHLHVYRNAQVPSWISAHKFPYGFAKAKVSCGSLAMHMVTQVAPTPTCYFLELSLPHVKVPMRVRPLHALLHQVAGKHIGMLDHPNQCVRTRCWSTYLAIRLSCFLFDKRIAAPPIQNKMLGRSIDFSLPP